MREVFGRGADTDRRQRCADESSPRAASPEFEMALDEKTSKLNVPRATAGQEPTLAGLTGGPTPLPRQATRLPDQSSPGLGDTMGTAGTPGPRRRPVLITLDGRRISERYVLAQRTSILGRDLSADVTITDGEVSRAHCRIEWMNFDYPGGHDPDCWIEDVGSTNGTFVNGQLIKGRHNLKDGDQIRTGKTVLGFFLKDERVLELDQLLLTMALNDSLTGLHKREFFFGELQREFDRARRHHRPLSLALVDIDFFKNVNDTHGHLRGDEALRQIAEVLRNALTEGELVARYGGEEFAVIFPETDGARAYAILDNLRTAVEAHPFTLGKGIQSHLTVSIGLAERSDRHTDKMQLLDEADNALYEAKNGGRNRIMVAPPPTPRESTDPLPVS